MLLMAWGQRPWQLMFVILLWWSLFYLLGCTHESSVILDEVAGNLRILGIIRLRRLKQALKRDQTRLDCQNRRPLVPKNVNTNCARLRWDVWVIHLGIKLHHWWLERIWFAWVKSGSQLHEFINDNNNNNNIIFIMGSGHTIGVHAT